MLADAHRPFAQSERRRTAGETGGVKQPSAHAVLVVVVVVDCRWCFSGALYSMPYQVHMIPRTYRSGLGGGCAICHTIPGAYDTRYVPGWGEGALYAIPYQGAYDTRYVPYWVGGRVRYVPYHTRFI